VLLEVGVCLVRKKGRDKSENDRSKDDAEFVSRLEARSCEI
jgi:hypothetical protein